MGDTATLIILLADRKIVGMVNLWFLSISGFNQKMCKGQIKDLVQI